MKLRQLKQLAVDNGMYVYKKRTGKVVVNFGDRQEHIFPSGTPLEEVGDFIKSPSTPASPELLALYQEEANKTE